jgi:hypothetical protein
MPVARELTVTTRATRAERRVPSTTESPQRQPIPSEADSPLTDEEQDEEAPADTATAGRSRDDSDTPLAREIEERQALLHKLQAEQEQRGVLDRLNAEIAQLTRSAGVQQAASNPPAPSIDTRSLLSGVLLDREEEDPASEASAAETRSRYTGASHPSNKAPLYQNPHPFKGKDLKEATMYLNAWRTVHELDPRRYPTERHKVLSASTFLAGEPQERWSNEEAKKFHANQEYDFEDFEAFISACVSDPHNRGFTLGLEYENATQKKDQTVTAFAAYLATLEDQLGVGYTDKQSAQHLLNKLRPPIREDIMLRGHAYATRADLVALATRFEQVSKERSNRYQEQRSEGSHKGPAKKPRRDYESQANRDSRPQNHSASTPRLQASQAATSRDECNKCHKKGHWARDCRSKDADAAPAVRAVGAGGPAEDKRRDSSGKAPRRKKTRIPA